MESEIRKDLALIDRLHASNNIFTGLDPASRMQIEKSVGGKGMMAKERAGHKYITRRWNPKNNNYDYIYEEEQGIGHKSADTPGERRYQRGEKLFIATQTVSPKKRKGIYIGSIFEIMGYKVKMTKYDFGSNGIWVKVLGDAGKRVPEQTARKKKEFNDATRNFKEAIFDYATRGSEDRSYNKENADNLLGRLTSKERQLAYDAALEEMEDENFTEDEKNRAIKWLQRYDPKRQAELINIKSVVKKTRERIKDALAEADIYPSDKHLVGMLSEYINDAYGINVKESRIKRALKR